MRRALVVGWFSFAGMGATAGDVMAAGVARRWLERAGRTVTVAAVPPLPGDVALDDVDPEEVDELLFVCGPFGNGWPVSDLLERFSHARLLGLDVSMLQPLEEWNPFDVLIERESDRSAHPDLVLAAASAPVPVIGLVEVHPQTEYGDRARHAEVGAVIRGALAQVEGAVVGVDTGLEANAGGLRTSAEVESLIARCDVVVTTRLHGMVLALKNAVPAVVVDPIAGGAKVRRQAERLGWPVLFVPEDAEPGALARAVRDCVAGRYRDRVGQCVAEAQSDLARAEETFRAELGG